MIIEIMILRIPVMIMSNRRFLKLTFYFRPALVNFPPAMLNFRYKVTVSESVYPRGFKIELYAPRALSELANYASRRGP